MKTRKFCPHCGRPVVKSQLKGYVFQCFACAEDFCRFEVYGKKNLAIVKQLRTNQMLRDRLHGHSIISFKKPYPRSKV